MFVIDGRKYNGTYFTKNLPHQQRAVDAINKVFDGVEITKPRQFLKTQ